MANRLSSKIIYLDAFDGSDVTLAEVGLPFRVRKIRLLTAADGDDFKLEDSNGNIIFHMCNNSGAADVVEVDFGDDGYDFGPNGVVVVISDCTGMAAGDGTDAVWIYLK